MGNLNSEIITHIDAVMNNPTYHIKTKQSFLEGVISYAQARLEDLKIEQEQTELLEFPDEMH